VKYICIDIGGANIKIFDGSYQSYYFPFWKKKDEFYGFLKGLNLKPDVLGVTITAECADCFNDKKEGINFVLDTLEQVFNCEIFVLSNNLNFKLLSIDEARKFPYNVCGANFLASGFYFAEKEKNGVLIDIGSTTTDIIPVKNGKIYSKTSDIERLQSNNLVYTGVLRTNVTSIVDYVYIDEKKTEISSEFFSITADVYRVLGDITEKDYSCETPDGKGKSIDECKRRLARIVCCDTNELSNENIISIAAQIKKAQIKKIIKSVNKLNNSIFNKFNKFNKFETKRFICGKGSFLSKELNAKKIEISPVKALYFMTKKFNFVEF